MAYASQAIQELDRTINSFKSRIDVKVNDVHNSSQSIQSTTDRIFENIMSFKTQMLEGEEKQIAHENVLRIDQILKEQFSNYVDTRRTVIGVIRDFDINLIRNSTIQELSEELWITSSRYWLSYALIAITAWINDYPELAKNALAESGRRDAIKTSLFFTLMNLRFNRVDVAKRWFVEYFKTLNPEILQNETAVLLQSFLNGIFGKDKELEYEIIQLIEEWIVVINENAEITEELIRTYENYILNMNSKETFSFESLKNYVKNYSEITKSYSDVSKMTQVLEFVKGFDVESELQVEENYKQRIDTILTNLISNYDAEELDLKMQQEYYKLIIENNGKVEVAESQFEEYVNLNSENFNFGRQLLRWVIFDSSNQTDLQVKKFGFQNTKKWFKSALNKWSNSLIEQQPSSYNIKIENWEVAATGDDYSEQSENLKAYFENNKFHNMYVNNPNIAAVIVLLASIGFAFMNLIAIAGILLSLGFLAYRVIQAQKTYPLRIKQAEVNLKNVFDEIFEYKRFFVEKLAIKDEIHRVAETI
jgi:hypothetical protein